MAGEVVHQAGEDLGANLAIHQPEMQGEQARGLRRLAVLQPVDAAVRRHEQAVERGLDVGELALVFRRLVGMAQDGGGAGGEV